MVIRVRELRPYSQCYIYKRGGPVMYKILEQELSKYNVFNGEIPIAISELAKTIPVSTIPSKMKNAMAVSELVTFASQFRRPIQHWNGSAVPINAITFILASSGVGKDFASQSIRKAFKSAYTILEDSRKEAAQKKAIKDATKDGVENPRDPKVIRKYYREPNPIFVAPSTTEGLIQHLNDLSESPVGAGAVFANELGSELSQSPVMGQIIQLLAETYDVGSKAVKVLKNRENQSKEVQGMPVSALLIGAPANILYDEKVKAIFKMEFTTKLSRRSMVCFNNTHTKPPDFSSSPDPIQALIDHDLHLERQAVDAYTVLDLATKDLCLHHLPLAGIPLTVDEDVEKLFLLYKNYNYYRAELLPPELPMSKLTRLHLQWKALKLAGAIAMFAMNESITLDDYTQAISFLETLDDDLQDFERELEKEKYELFVSYMHSITPSDKSQINLHHLRKLGYIPTVGSPEQKVRELIHLASAYDDHGIYTTYDKGVQFERIVKTQANGISYRTVSGTKDQRAAQSSYGFEFVEVAFTDLANMLIGDYAYSPFRFKDGMHGDKYIDSGCKWICLDIDKSTMTDEETHFILQDFNHHIVRTSDASNPFKYRILLELDAYVDLESKLWKPFIKSIAEYLQLTPDILPKSQKFFSYSGRTILSVTDKQPIAVKEHLMMAHALVEAKPTTTLSPAQKKAAVSNLRSTLDFAYESEDGRGGINLVKSVHRMAELGMEASEIEAVIRDINDYWVAPMSEERLERTILSQIDRIIQSKG